jgi:AcrR family transcriptional regulator
MPLRRTQAARSKATRDQIAQAAVAVFALKGYSAASMEDVALASGCSKGGLYHHFPSKGHLLRGVVERLGAERLLLPRGEGPQSSAVGRVLVEIWAEAARDQALRAQLAAASSASTPAEAELPNPLTQLLGIGALIQALTRPADPDARTAAARLGRRAA